MLKIPELPIYNTERYTNFSPISPDDIRPGDIYTNDSLFLYVSHFSFNKTAGYSVWDKEGKYVGTDMFSSGNIYAIVTYLNNNNFRPLDYDLEVIDPFNTDRRLLLTPNGIKKVNNVEEKYIRKKVSKLVEKVVRKVLKENINDNFDTNDNIVEEMDIDPKNKGKFTATQKRTGKSTEELCHSKNPLTRKRANFAKMAKRGWKPLNEAFKSNRLRSWAMAHGGIKKTEADVGYPNSNVRQDALSDVRDNDITYFEEFSDYNDAIGKRRMLMSKETPYGRRSKYDMSSYFTIYRANDGTCVLIGIDRNSIETSHTWGGEVSKKAADRFWRDEHLPYPTWSINRYPDETDKYYYYSKKGRDFGLKTNKNFQGKMRDNQKIRDKMSDEQWKEWQDKRVKDMDDYLTKYHGKGLKKR